MTIHGSSRPTPAGRAARPADHAELPLSGREREILAFLAQGRTNAECAHILGISPRTVGKHCENIYAKLGVTNRTGAARAHFQNAQSNRRAREI